MTFRCLTLRRATLSFYDKSRLFSSVASSEVQKFGDMNQIWWDPARNPLIHMNVTRVKYIVEQYSKDINVTGSTKGPLDGARALDIGCGGGLLSESLCRLGAEVTGVDPSHDLVEAAQSHAQLDSKTQKIDYRGGITAEELVASEAGSFDIVCLLEVVEHATDPESLLAAASRLVVPGGHLFVSTMNQTWKSYLLTIVGAEYVMGYLPVGTHSWNQYLSPEQVKTILSRSDMCEKTVRGMVLDKPPLFGKWDWRLDEKDFDVNWIASYRKEVSS